MTLTDTGPFIALIDSNDRDHDACRQALAQLPARPLATTWACFTEAMHLLRRAGGIRFQQTLWLMLFQKRIELLEITEVEVRRMSDLMSKYSDQPMDLADASLMAVAQSRGFHQIFTLDNDFLIYRLADGNVLEMLP